MTQEEIAEVMGISRRRVGAILIKMEQGSNFITDKPKVREAIRHRRNRANTRMKLRPPTDPFDRGIPK